MYHFHGGLAAAIEHAKSEIPPLANVIVQKPRSPCHRDSGDKVVQSTLFVCFQRNLTRSLIDWRSAQ